MKLCTTDCNVRTLYDLLHYKMQEVSKKAFKTKVITMEDTEQVSRSQSLHCILSVVTAIIKTAQRLKTKEFDEGNQFTVSIENQTERYSIGMK